MSTPEQPNAITLAITTQPTPLNDTPPAAEITQLDVPAEQLSPEQLLQRVFTLQDRVLALELKMQTLIDEEVRRSAELEHTRAESEARIVAIEARVAQIQSHVLLLQNVVMSSGSVAPPVFQRKQKA